MSEFSIQTAQNVKIEQNLAGIGLRLLAFLIDMFFLSIFYYFLFTLLEASGITDNMEAWGFISVLMLPYFLYFPLLQYWNNGQTIGKQIMKIRVVKIDNTHPGLGDFLIRWVLRLFEVTTVPGLALLVMILNDKNQRLGDIVAKTTVVSEAKRTDLKQSIFEDIDKDYQPVFLQVQNLSDRDLQLIKDVYRAAKHRKNMNLIRALTRKIEETMGINKPSEFSHSEFIETIIKDYNYFAHR